MGIISIWELLCTHGCPMLFWLCWHTVGVSTVFFRTFKAWLCSLKQRFEMYFMDVSWKPFTVCSLLDWFCTLSEHRYRKQLTPAAKVEAPCVFYCNAPSPTKTLYSCRIHFGRAAMGSRGRKHRMMLMACHAIHTLGRKVHILIHFFRHAKVHWIQVEKRSLCAICFFFS